jgi:hypothetical protein
MSAHGHEDSVHEILEDVVVRAHANRLLQDLLQDPNLRKETANALWGENANTHTHTHIQQRRQD